MPVGMGLVPVARETRQGVSKAVARRRIVGRVHYSISLHRQSSARICAGLPPPPGQRDRHAPAPAIYGILGRPLPAPDRPTEPLGASPGAHSALAVARGPLPAGVPT